MKVRISIDWQVIVDSQVDTLNIDTSAENVGRNTDTLAKFLEFFESFDTVKTRQWLWIGRGSMLTYRSS